MTDLSYTLYRLSVALLMPAGENRNVLMAACCYRLTVLRGVRL